MPAEFHAHKESSPPSVESTETAEQKQNEELDSAQKKKETSKKKFIQEFTAFDMLGQEFGLEGSLLLSKMEDPDFNRSMPEEDRDEFFTRESIRIMTEAQFKLQEKGNEDLLNGLISGNKNQIGDSLFSLGLGRILNETANNEITNSMALQSEIEGEIQWLMGRNETFSKSLLGGEQRIKGETLYTYNPEDYSFDEKSLDTTFDLRAGLDIYNLDPALYATIQKEWESGSVGLQAGISKENPKGYAAIQGGFRF